MGAGVECSGNTSEVDGVVTGALADWATDSLEASKLLYYQPGSQNLLKPGTKLDEAYYQVALPIVRLQLARAGVRVAWMLNQIFR